MCHRIRSSVSICDETEKKNRSQLKIRERNQWWAKRSMNLLNVKDVRCDLLFFFSLFNLNGTGKYLKIICFYFDHYENVTFLMNSI